MSTDGLWVVNEWMVGYICDHGFGMSMKVIYVITGLV